MINQFTHFIEENNLFKPTERVLLAVSGGIDSMAMWRLFEDARYDYSVIHCNFQLRGADSDADEELVVRIAEQRGIKLFVKKFDTREYALLMGISIEMAARELRYKWFEEIRIEEKFRYLATAHHLDDLMETFFINLVRKTGIKGLTGFRSKSGYLIRPMLFTNRQEIENYATQKDIEFRTDKSNNELIYQRNFIRHQIIPGLEKLNTAFRSNLTDTMLNLREVEDFYQTEVNRQIKRITKHDGLYNEITISDLMKLPHPRQVLFEWMNQFGFNPPTIEQIFINMEGDPGRQFYSKTHRLVIDRNKLIVTEATTELNQVFYIEEDDLEIFNPIHLTLYQTEIEHFIIDPDPRLASLDFDKLQFPLVVRKWNAGEYFQPLGMEGFKKISDFFIDQKLSIPEKENTWIIYSGDKVAWITGLRIDNRFKITTNTKNVFCIRLHLK
jgi:tRNA(Ile)-lysidine synthase